MVARNAERYVVSAVASVLNQDYRDLELVFVDDGSIDATRSIVSALDDRRIRLIDGPGRGLSSAHNAGLETASGEFVARLDADDIAEPDRTRWQVEYLDAHPEAVVVGSWTTLMDDEEAPLGVLRVPSRQEDVEAALANGGNPFLHPTVMFRAKHAREVGGYSARLDGLIGEDGEFLHRLCGLGRGANLPDPLVRYRLTRGAVSNGYPLLSSGLQRRREDIIRRVCDRTDDAADHRDAHDIAAAAREIDPELAYNYRVGKAVLQAGGDPKKAVRYLTRAWRLRPASLRVAKNLADAATRACLASVGLAPRSLKGSE
jgi:glycosyltransferase involved in cell wall biosynthesis